MPFASKTIGPANLSLPDPTQWEDHSNSCYTQVLLQLSDLSFTAQDVLQQLMTQSAAIKQRVKRVEERIKQADSDVSKLYKTQSEGEISFALKYTSVGYNPSLCFFLLSA